MKGTCSIANRCIRYSDREEVCLHELPFLFTCLNGHACQNVGYEVRAGLTSEYEERGWVADDIHSEAASRTLDYACKLEHFITHDPNIQLNINIDQDDDYAAAILASHLNHTADAAFFLARSMSTYKTIFNSDTGFMEARNANGTWAGPDEGWTEGDMWAYTFDVVHDVPGLVELKGGNKSFVAFLDEHFDGGKSAVLASETM